MTNPPQTIDGAKVLQAASLEGSASSGRTRHTVNGVELTAFAALALAQYPGQVGIYLFYCDDHWKAITDTYHDDLDGLIHRAALISLTGDSYRLKDRDLGPRSTRQSTETS